MAKLVCTVEMSKETGVTVTVLNADDSITQTVTMDGTTLTLKVEGGEETSTWTQTQDKIAINVKDFELIATNSIICTATKTIAMESKEGDTTLTSGAKLTQKATQDASLSSDANTTITAASAAKVEGATTTVEAQSSLTLKGGASAEMSAPTVTVKADAALSAKSSGTATLEGSMTAIKGSLITIG